MTVPAHNLYDFIHQVTEKRYWLLYFEKWGSRDLCDVIDYQVSKEKIYSRSSGLDPKFIIAEKIFPTHQDDFFCHRIQEFQPVLFCHDQEPLNFDYYNDANIDFDSLPEKCLLPRIYMESNQNLRHCRPMSNQAKWILLHSEKNSAQVKKYIETDRFVDAYWWSHALLARDWYRYAEHDLGINHCVTSKKNKTFLIYSRDHTGSRFYRKRFLDQIKNNPYLEKHCQIGSFDIKNTTPDFSAVYTADDFNHTDISVVLETVFWDDRIHLTEKILRPIAVGHPFILAAGEKSLELLKHYGFKTFSPWIDESYDQEPDHQKRLDLIYLELLRISRLNQIEKQQFLEQCRATVQYNKMRFFSHEFFEQVTLELKNNVSRALISTNNALDFNYYKILEKHVDTLPKVKKHVKTVRRFRDFLTQGGSLEQYQRHDHGLDDEPGTDCDNV